MLCRFRSAVSVALVLVAVSAQASDKARTPKPPLPAPQYPEHDTHAAEHVTIAAEPGDTRETAPDTRLKYAEKGMLPIRVIVTNDSDKPLTLEDARIDFIASDNTKVTAATPDDLNRRMYDLKYSAPKKIPLPAPLPSITRHNQPLDTKILADDTDFGFRTTTVPPHSTVAGYLFYDMQGLPDPPLKNATLELRKVRWKAEGSGAAGDVLDTFEIPLGPTDLTSRH